MLKHHREDLTPDEVRKLAAQLAEFDGLMTALGEERPCDISDVDRSHNYQSAGRTTSSDNLAQPKREVVAVEANRVQTHRDNWLRRITVGQLVQLLLNTLLRLVAKGALQVFKGELEADIG